MTGEAVAVPSAFESPAQDPAVRLARLFDLHHQRLFRLAYRLSGRTDDAHDLVQETFLRAARSPRSIPDDPRGEEGWLVRVLVNIARDGWRAAGVRRAAAAGGSLPSAGVTEPEPALIAQAMVRQALQALPPRRRAVLVLFELDGLPVADIASMLGVTAVTVRWHLSIGRREMARALGAGRRT